MTGWLNATLTKTAVVAICLLGAAQWATAQDGDLEALKRKIRQEVQRELAPEFQRQANELKKEFEARAKELQHEFVKRVEELVAKRVAELHHGGEAPVRPTPPPTPVRPTPAPTGGRPYLGLRLAEATEGVRVLLNLGDDGGLVVRSVEAGGPSERAGIQLEDVILSFDGTRVGTLGQLKDVLGRCQGGQTVTVELLREGRKQRLQLTLGGGSGAAPTPPTPVRPQPAPAQGSPRDRIRSLLRGLRDGLVERVEQQLGQAADAAERDELMRIVARKLLERLQDATDADHAEMLNALRQGLSRYLASGAAAAKDRAAALEELLEGVLHGKGGERKRDVKKLLDDILGEGGKKPGKTAPTPTQPDIPELDPEKLRDELARFKAKIEAEGFPQDMDEVRALVDSLLKRMNTSRAQVRRLIEMMGGPDGAKSLVKSQLEMNGIPLTDADLDKVMQVLMEEDGKTAPAKRAPAGKIGLSLDFVADGARVTRVVAGSPADKAGLQVDDLVLRLGAAVASNRDAVKAELSGRYAGDVVEARIRRGNAERTVRIVLEAAR